MDIESVYQTWSNIIQDSEMKEELSEMDGIAKQDAFYRDLEFGTGGLRGIIGAGTNRMNIYTVNKATQGLADYLIGKAEGNRPSVAIAYDSRIHSEDFARSAASVLAANGCKVYVFRQLMPTPVLSFAVRRLKCDAGIVVTASHNPAKYNGYKVYGNDGCQITLEAANLIFSYIQKIDIFADVKTKEFEDGIQSNQIRWIDDALLDEFIDKSKKCSVHTEIMKNTSLNVIYTPLNGTGNIPVRRVLSECGLKALEVVPRQEKPDGYFTTCPKPNPEERAAFQQALNLAERQHADLLLATDPDCDRVGIAVRDENGKYELMTGNETGCLLLHYVLSQKREMHTLPGKPVVIKTIVTTAMAYAIAADFGAEVINTLTGFKFIGEQIGLLEQKGKDSRYVFGFEESYGYLLGTHVRDKDAVSASLLICEMAAFYKNKNMTLIDALDCLYQKYGYWKHRLLSFAFEGLKGAAKMHRLEEAFRKDRYKSFAGLNVVIKRDYATSTRMDVCTGDTQALTLPKSNVLVFGLENSCEVIVRPSGTEPKFKCYLTAAGTDLFSVTSVLQDLEVDLRKIVEQFD